MLRIFSYSSTLSVRNVCGGRVFKVSIRECGVYVPKVGR